MQSKPLRAPRPVSRSTFKRSAVFNPQDPKIAIVFNLVNTETATWLTSLRGAALVAAESALLREALEDVFGWEMLQVGRWGGGRELLAASRSRRQTVVSNDAGAVGVDLCARLTQLPILSDSVDAVLLAHTLEFESDPYAVLREVDRVLTGEGQLLVLGVRPLSLWGLRAASSGGGYPPGLRRLLPAHRVRDWLILLGYEVTLERVYLYEAPWGEPAGVGRTLQRGWTYPWPGGAYLLKARKRVYAIPPVRLRLRERAQTIGGLVKPATRSGSTKS